MKLIGWMAAHIAVWMTILLAAGGVGNLLLGRLSFRSRPERAFYALMAGFGACATAVFCLGLLGSIRRPVLWGATLAAAAPAAAWLVRSIRPAAIAAGMRRAAAGDLTVTIAAGAAIAVAAFVGIKAFYPPTQWDAISNHLVIAREYLVQHRLVVVPGTPNRLIHALNLMLFTWGMGLLDDITAQLIEFTFVLLSAAGIFSYFRAIDRPLHGIAAALLWLCNPMLRWIGVSGYIDAGLAAYVLAGLMALHRYDRERSAGWLYLSFALLAMGAGVKLTGGFFLIPAAIYALRRWLSRAIGFGTVVRCAVLGLAIMAPWYGFIIYHTGNPFYPLFGQLNRGAYRMPEIPSVGSNSDFFAGAGPPKTAGNLLRLPFYQAFRQEMFLKDGGFGYLPVFALWPLVLVCSVWNRNLRWWAFWIAAYTLFWFATAPYLRYWMPVLPLIAIGLIEAAIPITGRLRLPESAGRSIAWAAAALSVVALLAGALLLRGRIDRLAAKLPPTDRAARESYLSKSGLACYDAVLYVNRNSRPGERVVMAECLYLNYYSERKVLGGVGRQWVSALLRDRGRAAALTESRYLEQARPEWIVVCAPGNPPERIALSEIGPEYIRAYAGAGSYAYKLTGE